MVYCGLPVLMFCAETCLHTDQWLTVITKALRLMMTLFSLREILKLGIFNPKLNCLQFLVSSHGTFTLKRYFLIHVETKAYFLNTVFEAGIHSGWDTSPSHGTMHTHLHLGSTWICQSAYWHAFRKCKQTSLGEPEKDTKSNLNSNEFGILRLWGGNKCKCINLKAPKHLPVFFRW